MSRRKLTPDEQDLWHKVARTTERLHPNRSVAPQQDPDLQKSVHRPKFPISDFQIGNSAPVPPERFQRVEPVNEQIARLPVAMDQKAFGKLRKGKLRPEARIDLHGMTQAQAQPALVGFILRAHGQRKRLVLVITGKGKAASDEGPIPVRRGVLRHAVPQWLRSPPLDRAVLQITEAHARHGGSGALYVYLRRQR